MKEKQKIVEAGLRRPEEERLDLHMGDGRTPTA
jgi:hypothetical protein